MSKLTFILFLLSTSAGFSQIKLNAHKFPEPEKTNNRLFYIQRSLNANTIIYDACFNKQGKLDPINPINIYWIRYEEGGQTMPLRYFEKHFAFGVNTQKLIDMPYDFKITLAAWNKRAIYIKQTAPFKAVAYVSINNSNSILDHIYVESDPMNYLSKAEYIEIYGLGKNYSSQNIERINL